MESALDFVIDVIKISEPRGRAASSPTPELVEGKWDDYAFAELASEYTDPDDSDADDVD